MTISLAIIFCATIYGLYQLASDYLTKARGSFAHAAAIWAEIARIANEIIESDIPPSVARAVVGLVATAGCGCFVRGMLKSYYFPVKVKTKKTSTNEWDRSFSDLRHLSDGQREKFDELMVRVIVYDGFRNPFQGWLFRRALKSFTKNEKTFVQRIETELTVFKVLSRSPTKLPPLFERSHV